MPVPARFVGALERVFLDYTLERTQVRLYVIGHSNWEQNGGGTVFEK